METEKLIRTWRAVATLPLPDDDTDFLPAKARETVAMLSAELLKACDALELSRTPDPAVNVGAVKALDWKHDGSRYYAYCGVTDTRWTASNNAEQERAEATRSARILSALSTPSHEAGSPAPSTDVGVTTNELRAALQEQVDACCCDDCEMCFRHMLILSRAATEGSADV